MKVEPPALLWVVAGVHAESVGAGVEAVTQVDC